MDKTPKVSVLMTVYNGEFFVEQAIDSILQQTFTDFEFIIVDDGSTDETWRILKNYAELDQRVVLLQNEINLGVSRSSNKGLGIARGKYIARLDSDDIALPHRLETQIKYLDIHPEIGVLGAQMKIISVEGEEISDYRVPLTHGEIFWRLFFGNPMAHPTIMFRRRIQDENVHYHRSLRASLDKELYARLIHRTRFANLNKSLVKYRRHKSSIWGSKADEAHAISSQIGYNLASKYLEGEISETTWELLDRSQNQLEPLADFEIKIVADFIHRLYDAVVSKESFEAQELEAIRADMLNRILVAGKKDGRIEIENIPEVYWQNRLPSSILKVVRGIANPKKVLQYIRERISTTNVHDNYKKVVEGTSDEFNLPGIENYGEKPEGVSIVIVSYERLEALKKLLGGLARQNLNKIDVEIIIVNNSSKVHISSGRLSSIGRLLQKFPESKVLNSSYNWGPGIRYAIATAASYRTILFFDDDIYPTHPAFVASMYRAFQTLNPEDILTCWGSLWIGWDEEQLKTVSMNFLAPEITDLTECDYCGTGISMLDKRILMHPEMLDIPQEYKFADTAWFPWIPSIVHGTRKYYFPSFDMLTFHKEMNKGSLYLREGYNRFIFAARKLMLERGYQPVLSKLPGKRWREGSPEQKAVQNLSTVTWSW